MKKRLLINLVSVIAGLGGGFLTAQNFTPQQDSEELSEEPVASARFSVEGSFEQRGRPAHEEAMTGKVLPKALEMRFKYGNFTADQLKEEFYIQLSAIEEQVYFDSPAIMEIFKRWGELAPLQAMMELEKAGSRYSDWKENILEGWALRDPVAAAAYYLENRETLYRGDSLSRIMNSYAELMPDEAWESFNSLSNEEKKSSMHAFLKGILAGNPERMAEFVSKFTGWDDQSREVSFELLEEWSRKEADHYAKWLESQPEKKQQEIMARFCTEMTMEDPRQAGKIFSELPAETQEKAYDAGLWTMFEKLGPAEAFEWIISNSAEELVVDTMDRNAGMIRPRDYDEVLRFVENLDQGEARDKLMYQLASMSPPEGSDFSKIISLTESLSGTAERNHSLKTVVRNWLQADYASASAWLDRSSFSSAEKEEVKKNLPQTTKTWIK